MDDGKKLRFAAFKSSADSSASPAPSGTSPPESSSASSSARCSGATPQGTRNPVRYQFDGRIQPGSSSSANGPSVLGPIRFNRSASSRRSRTSNDALGASEFAAEPPAVGCCSRFITVGRAETTSGACW